MFLNNSFNILPWYDSLEKQSSKKWYAFGQSWPLLCPKGVILPFQFVCEALEVTSNIQAVNVNTNEITDLGITPSVIQGSQPNSTYYIVKLASATIPVLPVGTYYLRFNTSLGYLYSEEITIIDDSSECIKIQYWNEDTLNFTSGEINFADDFKFEFYIRSTIGKPEYEFEEELTKRLGYKFIESQTSNKVYKFAFVAPEYICDAMRLIRLCDYVKLTTKFDSYNALSFAYEPKWQDQGDLAAVDVEFDTDCIIQKLESFNRRIKESFYNALLADIDEPVLFSTDTVAQYYTEFTTTSFINGKLIRQLESILPDELQSDFANLVLPIDNMVDDKNTAKKVSLPDLMSLVTPSDISKLFKGHFDADGNLLWIEALSHIGVNGGVTMFIDNGTMSLPQLYFGLPIDGKTLIRDDNGVLMINPDIDFGGGTSTWDELVGKPSWITDTKPNYSYSEIEGTPDLSVYVKSSVLTSELAKYVTLGGDETISGLKDFTKGLKISGLGISKSQDDVIYIDANLVVRGGITMYAEGDVDIPSILDSLPIASTTAKGIASFDSSYFSVDSDGKVTLLSENVGLNEAELAAYLSNNGYATQTWVNGKGYALSADLTALQTKVNDFLEGSDTDTIINKWLELEAFLSGLNESDNLATILSDKANKATTLAGYGITDAYTKSAVDTLLGNYVTLKTTQTITGEKNFTGGLKVNGSPIVYDATNKYWKLEGDLLVTGGVTMYANEGTYTPSTIMNGLVLDSATLGINDEGQLYVKGGTGGGVADSVAWENVTGKPSFAAVATSGKYSDLSGKPTLLSSFTNDAGFITSFTDTKNTAGATNTSSKIFLIGATAQNANPQTYSHDTAYVGTDGCLYSGGSKVLTAHQTIYNLTLQAGTFSAKTFDPNGAAMTVNIPTTTSHISEGTNLYFTNARAVSALSSTLAEYLPLSGGTINGTTSNPLIIDTTIPNSSGVHFYTRGDIKAATGYNNGIAYISNEVANGVRLGIADNGLPMVWADANGNTKHQLAYITSNVASATKLQTARTIWGQPFDGTGNVSGDLNGVTDIVGSGNIKLGGIPPLAFPNYLNSSTLLSNQWHTLIGYNNIGLIIGVGPDRDRVLLQAYDDTLDIIEVQDRLYVISGAISGDTNASVLIDRETSGEFLKLVCSKTATDNNAFIKISTEFSNLSEVNNSVIHWFPKNSQFTKNLGNTGTSMNINTSGTVTFGEWSDSSMPMYIDLISKKIGIGTINPAESLHVIGNCWTSENLGCGGKLQGSYITFEIAKTRGVNNSGFFRMGRFDETDGGVKMQFGGTGTTGKFEIVNKDWTVGLFGVDKSGNGLFSGGVTMYSDIRKKTKLQDVELSLKQIADAPLIEHYYNSDAMRTTHVGSIAQYWAGLNDWFCKEDSEGFYTMEIQNAALASAISIARELVKFESKTDRKIRLLKDEVKRLKKEIKILKSA